jgi:hypothetical protein
MERVSAAQTLVSCAEGSGTKTVAQSFSWHLCPSVMTCSVHRWRILSNPYPLEAIVATLNLSGSIRGCAVPKRFSKQAASNVDIFKVQLSDMLVIVKIMRKTGNAV